MTTEKGEIIIKLDVENAPSTVAYISKLAKEGFYDGLIWHRVVSNFVVQGGDPFGNGTGSAQGTLRSEHSLNEYREGAVGIASAGKDTESCQFFITHNYTPHLNGRYTIIGYVVEGMDVVHKTQVNDEILKVELID
ncbi:MAG: peptidylprolyl isomerase [Bacteroidia bacterium]